MSDSADNGKDTSTAVNAATAPQTASDSTASTTTAGSAEKITSVKDSVLRIESLKEQADRVDRKWIPLSKGCPKERGFWPNFAHTAGDKRDLGALTLEFISLEQDDVAHNRVAQDGIRAGLWTALMDLLAKKDCKLPDDLPRIAFEEVKDDEDHAFGRVILTFSSLKPYRCVRDKLQKIQAGGSGSKERIYKCSRSTNNLPGSIFRIDCINLPLEGLNIDALSAALATMVKDLGSLLGIAKVVTKSKQLEYQADSGNIRAYVQLARRWLGPPMRELISHLPSHLVWHGLPYQLLYHGYDLHEEERHSADYPFSSHVEGESEAAGTSRSRETSSEEGDQDSGNVSKKRKTDEE